MEIRTRPVRTSLLWLLAALIVVLDQLTKAWFVFQLGSGADSATFGQFLGDYFRLFATDSDSSIIYDTYGPFFRTIWVWEPWLRWRLTTNTGAAWSMFAGNSFVLSFISISIAALLWWIWRRSFVRHLGMTIAIGAIIGGALGNAIDRFRLREVVDFIAVKIPFIGKLFPKLGDPYDFPIFNVADSAAVCGTIALAGYLLWLDISQARRRRKSGKDEPESFRPFAGGLQLDDEARENLRNLDTSSLPPWQQTPEQAAAEQEEASREYVDRLIAADRADDLPQLTNDYSSTESARRLIDSENDADSAAATESAASDVPADKPAAPPLHSDDPDGANRGA